MASGAAPTERHSERHGLATLLEPSRVWYREYPAAAAVVSAALFLAVSVFRLVVGNGEAATVLFVLPVSLLAVSFGRRGGWLGAALGVALVGVFLGVGGNEDVDATGIVTRVVALCLLGGLLGHAVDRTRMLERRALEEQRRRLALEETERREREALEINDSIIQGMVGAKWLAEQGEADGAAAILDRTIEQGQRLVTELLTRTGDAGARRAVPPSSTGWSSGEASGG